ncbi:MAG: hypothetical protein MUF75_04630 [Bacteroidia bacterium]|nr:hypothetical protein [Bacteroidia bacterium]
MARLKLIIPVFFTLLNGLIPECFAQTKLKVLVRAEEGLIYFYKKGPVTDSTFTKTNTLFYLVCKPSQQRNILIGIDNARLMASKNDSLVYAEYLPGLKYEAWFVQSEDSLSADGTIQKGKMVFTSFLNGTTQVDTSRIRIQIYLKKENELILENTYYLKD